LKSTLVAAVVTLIAAEIVYAFLRSTPWWWLYSAAALSAGVAGLTLVAPLWLVPLFYRLSPLADPVLRERLVALADRAGAPVLGVWVADQSRKARTVNAAVTGLGRTRRIVLFDTLVRDFPPDEVEVVLAHELAHHLHRDAWRGLAVQAGVLVATLWAADQVLRATSSSLRLDGPADLAGLPLVGLVLLGAGLVALPVVNGWSRRCERRADEFAVKMTSRPRAFIDAMERLARLNLAERDPHPVKEFLLYSHPSVGRRIALVNARLGPHG
jgi:STE24 endopeptidase